MYRPDGWINPHKESETEYDREGFITIGVRHYTFERGASAMLKALREKGIHTLETGEEWTTKVYIPDD